MKARLVMIMGLIGLAEDLVIKPFKGIDRRRSKRFAVVGKPLAVMRPGPGQSGLVTRVSTEAVEILYPASNGAEAAATDELDILMADFTRGLHLQHIPVKTVSDRSAESSERLACSNLRKRIVAFGRLTADQKSDLQSFISAYAR